MDTINNSTPPLGSETDHFPPPFLPNPFQEPPQPLHQFPSSEENQWNPIPLNSTCFLGPEDSHFLGPHQNFFTQPSSYFIPSFSTQWTTPFEESGLNLPANLPGSAFYTYQTAQNPILATKKVEESQSCAERCLQDGQPLRCVNFI
jgi:hypothetical protein